MHLITVKITSRINRSFQVGIITITTLIKTIIKYIIAAMIIIIQICLSIIKIVQALEIAIIIIIIMDGITIIIFPNLVSIKIIIVMDIIIKETKTINLIRRKVIGQMSTIMIKSKMTLKTMKNKGRLILKILMDSEDIM